jgi:hypothetical protein
MKNSIETQIDLAIWEVLKQVKKDYHLTAKDRYVCYEVSQTDRPETYPLLDDQRKIIEKLEDLGVFKIHSKGYGTRGVMNYASAIGAMNGAKPSYFLIDIDDKTFNEKFLEYEKKHIKPETSVHTAINAQIQPSLRAEVSVGKLIAYSDGTIRYQGKHLDLRPQIKDLCRLFMERQNQLINADDIREKIIKASKRKATSFDTISKYISELHKELQNHFGKEVITNQPKDGWIFNP